MNRTTFYLGIAILVLSTLYWAVSCSDKERTSTASSASQPAAPMPRLGSKGDGPSYDKSSDIILQNMIDSVAPKFVLHEFHDIVSGNKIAYNLLSPAATPGKKYPLILFMADASTPGLAPSYTLTQGYGALVWGTDAWQRIHPCYVLVPQFSGVAVNDAFKHTAEVDAVIRLLDTIANEYAVDTDRIYTTGQSMGGMISMYYNVTYPNVFAASLLVDCHWDPALFPELAHHKIAYIVAGGNPKSTGGAKALMECAEQEGIKYEYTEFSARLPLHEQDSITGELLKANAPLNVICFKTGTVLPPGDNGNEHMHSFDAAYSLTPIREWLFSQHK